MVKREGGLLGYFQEKSVKVGFTVITAMLILLAINLLAGLWGLPLRVMNITCVLAFIFFVYTLLPSSLKGFALTLREWGDIYRREMHGIDVPTAADFRRAAGRSLAVLTAVILFGAWMQFFRRDVGVRIFMQSVAVLIGMESGFVIGYLVVIRRRSSPP